MQAASPAYLFQTAVYAYQQKRYQEAESICLQLLNTTPNQADIMHLLALCLTQRSVANAEFYFKKAITTKPHNDSYKISYANFLMLNHRQESAVEIFQNLKLRHPQNLEVAYGLAFSQYKQKEYRSALNSISEIQIYHPDAIKLLLVKSRALLDSNNIDSALEVINQALTINSEYPGLKQEKVLILRQLQKPERALEYLHLMDDNAENSHLKGCLYYDMRRYDESEKHLLRAIQQKADHIESHIALNKLYWEHQNTTKFLTSFIQALSISPHATSVYLSYISHLLMADSIDEAIAVAEKAIKLCGVQPQLLHALGTALSKRGENQTALKLYRQAAERAPTNVRCLIDAASMLIRNENYNEALDLLNQAQQFAPENQEIWAYLGLCWRLTSDPRHHWLNNYATLVSVKKLPTPRGYENFTHFWQELTNAIKTLHTTMHHPLDQSVRNGTQTVGYLFNNTLPVIKIYKDLIADHVRQYLNHLPSDSTHPLLRRNQLAFRFSGAWSVKLKNDGYHTNHVHPQGWLSVCTYLTVPDAISATDPKYQGWLKLGETSLQLGEREQIARTICPEEGLCVIFPSYMWHGTLPFHGDGPRITLPCDVVPDI